MPIHLLPPDQIQTGPYSLEEVRRMWGSGQLTLRFHYWQEGMADRKPIQDLEPTLRGAPPRQQPVAVPVTTPWIPFPHARPPRPEATTPLLPLPASSVSAIRPQAVAPAPVGGEHLSAYYRREFIRIHESGETYRGAWNWAAFFFGPLWAFHKGVWLSGISAIIVSVVITFLTFGLGAIPMMLIYAYVFGSRGTRIYYQYRVNNRQTRFG